jgi:hypothetical protein
MTPDSLKSKVTKEEKVTKTKSADAKSQVLEVSGLCVSCNLAEGCTYQSGSKTPVHYCEEFTETGPKVQTMFRKIPSQLAPKEEYKHIAGLKGLCVNCDFRETCQHGISEGGVWHCENYR